MIERLCEAEIHARRCDGQGTTRDHLTPQAIGRSLGWKHKQINALDNIQYLSKPCHSLKDQPTPAEASWVKETGGGKTLFAHHNELLVFKLGKPKV